MFNIRNKAQNFIISSQKRFDVIKITYYILVIGVLIKWELL